MKQQMLIWGKPDQVSFAYEREFAKERNI